MAAAAPGAPKRILDYPLDLAAACVVVLYLVFYVVGRAANGRRLRQFVAAYKPALRQQFHAVGGDKGSDAATGFVRESDSEFSAWCTGRRHVAGALVTLQLAPRQDLFSVVQGFATVSYFFLLLLLRAS